MGLAHPRRRNNVCRLSIVVPYDRDEAAFEATLVSVLENRPEYCEVLVVHDGSYSDPFDLEDEVRFVVAESNEPIDLIRAAAHSSLGRIVHVLGGGARATELWTEEPLGLFEQSDLGAVAPVIRDLSEKGKIVAAGWKDAASGLRRPLGAGEQELDQRQLGTVQGVYLQASFWRRSVLESVCELAVLGAPSVVDYLWAGALKFAGWRCRIASQSTVVASPKIVCPTDGSMVAARAMQQVRNVMKKEGKLSTGLASLSALASRPFSGAAWGEAVGRWTSPNHAAVTSRKLAVQLRQLAESAGPNAAQAQILKMPAASSVAAPLRRAA